MNCLNARLPCLVCDLDGTLCRTDTLQELILRALSTAPLMLLRASCLLLTRGRLAFKLYLTERISLDPVLLPYNAQVLSALRQARSESHQVILATASPQTIADAVASRLALFDAVYGSTPQCNLKGKAKTELLVSLYGEKGFDYIGDSQADSAVFTAARRSYLARPRHNTLRPLDQTASPGRPLTRTSLDSKPQVKDASGLPGEVGRPILRALRPHQWAKNALVLAPLLLAHDFSAAALASALLALVIFCAAASAGYIVNDCLDLSADRAHPAKRHRPFASGALSPLPWFTGAALVQIVDV